MPMKKILIIDDEPDVITYLRTVLEANDFEAYSANNVRSAMDEVKEIKPDLICLDIMMPNETGITFYLKLRKENDFINTPVILLSGIVDLEKFDFRKYAKDNSIPKPNCYMEKPIDVDKYIKTINELLSGTYSRTKG